MTKLRFSSPLMVQTTAARCVGVYVYPNEPGRLDVTYDVGDDSSGEFVATERRTEYLSEAPRAVQELIAELATSAFSLLQGESKVPTGTVEPVAIVDDFNAREVEVVTSEDVGDVSEVLGRS